MTLKMEPVLGKPHGMRKKNDSNFVLKQMMSHCWFKPGGLFGQVFTPPRSFIEG